MLGYFVSAVRVCVRFSFPFPSFPYTRTGGCLINLTIHADMVHGTLLLFGLVAATLSVGKV